MIQSALKDWADEPVITSLDSISYPIDTIQFPTITVCKNEYKEQPDNWAYLEKLLNLLLFDCDGISSKCTQSKRITDDLRFVSESLINSFDGWLSKPQDDAHDIDLVLGKGDGYEAFLSFVKKQALDGNLDYQYVKNLAINNLGKTLYKHNLYKMVLNEDQYDGDIIFNVTCGKSQDCIKIDKMVRLLIKITSSQWLEMGYGAFLRNFIGLREFSTFSQSKTLEEVKDGTFSIFYDDGLLCDELTNNENFVHEYFSNLSRILGFHGTGLINLYELPGQFSSLIDQKEADLNLVNVKMSQASLHSRCKEEPSLDIDDANQCPYEWLQFLNDTDPSDPIENPCHSSKIMCCNPWSSKISHDLTSLMKVMRFASRRGRSHFELESLIKKVSYPDLLFDTAYYEFSYLKPTQMDYQTLIPICEMIRFDDGDESQDGVGYRNERNDVICDLFEPVFTDVGMCHTYNALPVNGEFIVYPIQILIFMHFLFFRNFATFILY